MPEYGNAVMKSLLRHTANEDDVAEAKRLLQRNYQMTVSKHPEYGLPAEWDDAMFMFGPVTEHWEYKDCPQCFGHNDDCDECDGSGRIPDHIVLGTWDHTWAWYVAIGEAGRPLSELFP